MDVPDWASQSDQELVERRISKLGLRLEGTALEQLIRQLYEELSAHGLVFHPPCHVGDEWFVPIGITAIFVPFFLVHDRLRALERTMMLEVEGGTEEWFMQLMRHEEGHAYTYDYQLTRQKMWRQTCGPTSRDEKLKTYYARKRKLYEETYPDFYDADLRQLFAAQAGIKASSYLRQRRRRLMNSVCQWTNEKKFSVNRLLARLIDRCDQLGLHVHNDDPQQDFRVSAFITTLVMNYLFTGKFKRTK